MKLFFPSTALALLLMPLAHSVDAATTVPTVRGPGTLISFDVVVPATAVGDDFVSTGFEFYLDFVLATSGSENGGGDNNNDDDGDGGEDGDGNDEPSLSDQLGDALTELMTAEGEIDLLKEDPKIDPIDRDEKLAELEKEKKRLEKKIDDLINREFEEDLKQEREAIEDELEEDLLEEERERVERILDEIEEELETRLEGPKFAPIDPRRVEAQMDAFMLLDLQRDGQRQRGIFKNRLAPESDLLFPISFDAAELSSEGLQIVYELDIFGLLSDGSSETLRLKADEFSVPRVPLPPAAGLLLVGLLALGVAARVR